MDECGEKRTHTDRRQTQSVSTIRVPAKFCQMMPLLRLRRRGSRPGVQVIPERNDVRTFLRHIGAGAHRYPDISFGKPWRIVYSVAYHGDHAILCNQLAKPGRPFDHRGWTPSQVN